MSNLPDQPTLQADLPDQPTLQAECGPPVEDIKFTDDYFLKTIERLMEKITRKKGPMAFQFYKKLVEKVAGGVTIPDYDDEDTLGRWLTPPEAILVARMYAGEVVQKKKRKRGNAKPTNWDLAQKILSDKYKAPAVSLLFVCAMHIFIVADATARMKHHSNNDNPSWVVEQGLTTDPADDWSERERQLEDGPWGDDLDIVAKALQERDGETIVDLTGGGNYVELEVNAVGSED